jgi:hypothetical protein
MLAACLPPVGKVTDRSLKERYAGRPLLRLLDDYVLDIIGALPAETHPVLLEVVRLAYPNTAGATWQEVLENELQLEPDFKRKIHAMWLDYQQFIADQGHQADPSEFAVSFTNENFLPLIHRSD